MQLIKEDATEKGKMQQLQREKHNNGCKLEEEKRRSKKSNPMDAATRIALYVK